MTRVMAAVALGAVTVGLSGCGSVVAGTPTWPGEHLEKVLLTQADFPAGVVYDRITDEPGTPDGAGGPPSMLSRPPGCANALTDVIAKTAERGPGSAAKYSVAFDGARIVMTVLSSRLDLGSLAAAAARCEHFETFFDTRSPGIPITTTTLPSGPDALAYEQTMQLGGSTNSFYMSFANAGGMGVFGAAFPTKNPTISVKGTLPQTFLDTAQRQAARIAAS
ncbi:MAG: hypothetical protein HYZ38_22280 [Mycobacterium sp.]|nr:hypothetical protein [Mycobacterium sp.]